MQNSTSCRAASEHICTFTICISICSLYISSSQAGAAIEHAYVAVVGQSRGRQLGRFGQFDASTEHALIAVISQSRSGQQQTAGVNQIGVNVEKFLESRCRRQRGVDCGKIILVHQAHDVAIHLHLGRTAHNFGDVITGGCAVKLHLVTNVKGAVIEILTWDRFLSGKDVAPVKQKAESAMHSALRKNER